MNQKIDTIHHEITCQTSSYVRGDVVKKIEAPLMHGPDHNIDYQLEQYIDRQLTDKIDDQTWFQLRNQTSII